MIEEFYALPPSSHSCSDMHKKLEEDVGKKIYSHINPKSPIMMKQANNLDPLQHAHHPCCLHQHQQPSQGNLFLPSQPLQPT